MAFTITTHRSPKNSVIERNISKKINQIVDKKRKSKRYKRIWFYFFEKEIYSDISKELRQSYQHDLNYLLDPEYQHLVARSSLGNNYTYTPYHALDAIVNDYIFQV